MDTLKMHSLDGVQRNIELIGKLFPNAITEVKRDGKVKHAIDFDVLRQELSDSIVEGREERYQFTWPDKKKAMLAANAPITATLRPVVADSVGKDGTPGGFDSGSYREAKRADEDALHLTPAQQKLAVLENRLPTALRNRGAALALSIVVMLAAFFGLGGAKLKAKYNSASQWFSYGVAADNGYTLNEELLTRLNTAANVITTGTSTLGADSTEVQAAQTALDDFSACLDAVQADGSKQDLTSLPYYQGSTMHALYQANEALGAAIDQLYAKLQERAADPMKMGAVQGQYGQFNSAQTILSNLNYNQAVTAYQNDTSGFPAALLKGLFGIREVEPFA